MTDNSLSGLAASPFGAPPAGWSIWTPGLWLVRQLSLRRKAMVLLLCAWLPLLLLAALLDAPAPRLDIDGLDPLRSFVDGRFGVGAAARWGPLSLLAGAGLMALYLTVCVVKALFESLERLHRAAIDIASGHPPRGTQDGAADEFGAVLAALGAAAQGMARHRESAARQAGVVECSARELADAHQAMQLEAREMRATIGEIARRTVALCGMLDSDRQDAERAAADIDAIQDEERQTLQLMAALRARLLAMAQHLQALGEVARNGAAARLEAAGAPVAELIAAMAAEITHGHQLSERVGGAERLNERRIESMRLSTERLVCRVERGMREAQQLMVLTRQAEASLAATLRQLEQMAAASAALRTPAEAAAPGAALPAPEPTAA